jgi:hypothetical protein
MATSGLSARDTLSAARRRPHHRRRRFVVSYEITDDYITSTSPPYATFACRTGHAQSGGEETTP